MFNALNTEDRSARFPAIKHLRDFLTGAQASLIIASMNRGIAELTCKIIWLELTHQKLNAITENDVTLEGVEYFRSLQPDRVARIAAALALPKTITAPAATAPGRRPPPAPVSHLCDCGRPAVKKIPSGWSCERCAALEKK
jgi:hypothetical protein